MLVRRTGLFGVSGAWALYGLPSMQVFRGIRLHTKSVIRLNLTQMTQCDWREDARNLNMKFYRCGVHTDIMVFMSLMS